MPYIPHTEQDIKAMLAEIGISKIDDLFDEIPNKLRLKGLLSEIPESMNEAEISKLMEERAAKDKAGLCFIGAGAYEHHIPAVIWDIAGRGEFMTAYTPYQAEASQGTLQTIYEYQSMTAHLMEMDVCNASMYDGASALAEAVLMAIRANQNSKSKTILVPRTVNPYYRTTIKTVAHSHRVELIELPFLRENGTIDLSALKEYEGKDITAIVIQQPNFFGSLEDVDALTDWAHKQKALVIASVNPLSIALLEAPGNWGTNGADIATAEGQPLGAPLSSGGPYLGLMCCKSPFMRQLPGRIVGRTVDTEGKEGFVLTLQAREQHIRRSKATSNICSNQALMATVATIYMGLTGAEGMQRIAAACHENAKTLYDKLSAIDGVEKVFKTTFFHEFVLHFKKPVVKILEELAAQGIQGGYSLMQEYPELGNAILVCATETKTASDIDLYAKKLKKIV